MRRGPQGRLPERTDTRTVIGPLTPVQGCKREVAMTKKHEPLSTWVDLIEITIKNYSDPDYWSNRLKPLPIESYLDFEVAYTIFYLYGIWRDYKDPDIGPDTSQFTKEHLGRLIKRLVEFPKEQRQTGAPPQSEKSLFIYLFSPLVKEKDYYSEYKQLRKTKEYEVAKKEILGRIVRDFAGKRVLFFSVDPGFEKKLKKLNWRRLTPTKFNNHLIAYFVGYSHPDSVKVLKSRSRPMWLKKFPGGGRFT